MTVKDDLAAAARAVADLRNATAGLEARLGNTVDVRRLKDDVARFTADLQLIAHGTQVDVAGPQETVYIPEGDYDPSLWADAEDEGLGTRGRLPGQA
ncbi:MAG: hypothetical protein ACLGIV_15300 [Actinomycetes bacterium]